MRDRDRAQLAFLHQRRGVRRVGERHLDVAGDQVGQHLAHALVGHMHHVGAGELLQFLGAEMKRGADADRAVIDGAGLGLREVEQFLQVLRRQVVGDHDGVRGDAGIGDGREILQRVVGQGLEQARIDREGVADQQDGVAVGRRPSPPREVPIWVAPPPRFSMVKGWPSRLPTSSDMVRAMMSEVPPAAYGMMTRIGCVGFHCARGGRGECREREVARPEMRSASDADVTSMSWKNSSTGSVRGRCPARPFRSRGRSPAAARNSRRARS